jgi:hypothetical protein
MNDRNLFLAGEIQPTANRRPSARPILPKNIGSKKKTKNNNKDLVSRPHLAHPIKLLASAGGCETVLGLGSASLACDIACACHSH